jgi:hypothetical protein
LSLNLWPLRAAFPVVKKVTTGVVMIMASLIARVVVWFSGSSRPEYRCADVAALAMLDSAAGG